MDDIKRIFTASGDDPVVAVQYLYAHNRIPKSNSINLLTIEEVFDMILKTNKIPIRQREASVFAIPLFELFQRCNGVREACVLAHVLSGKSFGFRELEFVRLFSNAICHVRTYNPDALTEKEIHTRIKSFLDTNTFESLIEYIKSNKNIPTGTTDQQAEQETFIKPMLADVTHNPNELTKDAKWTVEYKYDGHRVQIWYNRNGKTRIQSRSGRLIEGQYTDVVDAIQNYFGPEVDSITLDGEMVPVSETGELLPFQNITQRSTKEFSDKQKVKLVVFDMLYLNGEYWLEKTLQERREELNVLIKPSSMIQLTKYFNIESGDDVFKIFKQSLIDNCEGIMLKRLDQKYHPNRRMWYKYKKEYNSALFDSLDLVPIGASIGKNKRVGLFGSYLMACWNDIEQRFDTVCFVGTGFSNEQLTRLTQDMAKERVTEKPDNYNVNKAAARLVDVWFKPNRVWEINGADFSISKAHTCIIDGNPISLRFPKLIKEREDKGVEDSTNTTQMQNHYRKRTQFDQDPVKEEE